MADYIDREAIFQEVKDSVFSVERNGEQDKYANLAISCFRDVVLARIRNFPAADVRPVVRGRWTWEENGMDWGIGAWRCSVCGVRSPMWWNTERTSPMNKNGHCFCPNCGAEMEGVDG